jgi:hypothetical protein
VERWAALGQRTPEARRNVSEPCSRRAWASRSSPSSPGGQSSPARRAPAALLDNAIRIPAADLPHVFERFYQADDSRDRTTGTSVLGLAIVKAIADAHGASVGAANVTTGGARFWIDLAGSAG